MQWFMIRLWLELLSALTVLQVFGNCRDLWDIVATLEASSDAAKFGIVVAAVIVISGPIDLAMYVCRYFRSK